MIRPPEFGGAAFGDAADGDPRTDDAARLAMAGRLGIPEGWAWLHQVHGTEVLHATHPGPLGEADAAFTAEPGLPIVVATADCFPVIVEGVGGVGIAHAGWRGAAAGVITSLLGAMAVHGITPIRAAVGPGIGACCFEVGPEVTERFPGHGAMTSWGTPSVDLRAAIVAALGGLETWVADTCTMSGVGYHSHRRDGTRRRQVAVAWLPG